MNTSHKLKNTLRANLTVNLAKCEFGKAAVTYLGKVVGGGCVKPINANVEAVCSFPTPTTRRKLRSFLGMVGYYRGFCHNFANVVAPLTDLLSPKRPFEWSQQCQCAFDNAKSLLANAPVLGAPNFERPSYLQLMLVLMALALFFCKKMLRESNMRSVIFQKIKSSSACVYRLDTFVARTI